MSLRDGMVVVAAEKLHLSIEAQRRQIDDLYFLWRLLSLRQRPAIQEHNVEMVCETTRDGKRANEMSHAKRMLAIKKKFWAKGHPCTHSMDLRKPNFIES